MKIIVTTTICKLTSTPPPPAPIGLHDHNSVMKSHTKITLNRIILNRILYSIYSGNHNMFFTLRIGSCTILLASGPQVAICSFHSWSVGCFSYILVRDWVIQMVSLIMMT